MQVLDLKKTLIMLDRVGRKSLIPDKPISNKSAATVKKSGSHLRARIQEKRLD